MSLLTPVNVSSESININPLQAGNANCILKFSSDDVRKSGFNSNNYSLCRGPGDMRMSAFLKLLFTLP